MILLKIDFLETNILWHTLFSPSGLQLSKTRRYFRTVAVGTKKTVHGPETQQLGQSILRTTRGAIRRIPLRSAARVFLNNVIFSINNECFGLNFAVYLVRPSRILCTPHEFRLPQRNGYGRPLR